MWALQGKGDFLCPVGNFPSLLKECDVSAFFMEIDIEFKNTRLYEEKIIN